MPQNVPTFEFSDRAKQVRAFVFDFWCEHGRGPTLREVHDATKLDRRRIIQAYKELQLGIVITVDENTQNCNLLKAPPFSSYPSQVRAYIDDEFHSFVGCASEAVAFSHMPPFKDKTVRLESHIRDMSTLFQSYGDSEMCRNAPVAGVMDWISKFFDSNEIGVKQHAQCDSIRTVLSLNGGMCENAIASDAHPAKLWNLSST